MTRSIESANAPRASGPPGRGWPAEAPELEVAECALLAALDAVPPPFPELGGVAARVARELSELECRALRGTLLEVDALPIRRAAGMRLRVGVALGTAPPPGASGDAVAISALLSEIDGLLDEVNGLADDASPEVMAGLGHLRGALVKAAIDFSEVAQRHAVVDARDAELPERWAASGPSTSGDFGAPAAVAPPRRVPWLGILVAAAIVVAFAAARAGCLG